MKNNKGFAPIAIALVVVAVLALGGTAYYAGKSSNPTSQNVPQDNIINDSESNSESVESSITLISPNGGETLQNGSIYKINWESLNLPSTAKIYVSLVRGFKGDIDYNELSKNVVSGLSSTTNNYLWKVDTSDLGLGSDYTIVVVATWGSFDAGTFARTYDSSNAPFKISSTATTPQDINITFPTIGTTLIEGQTYNITWINSDKNTTYRLYLENNQVGSIRIGETSGNSFSWKVPSILSYLSTADGYKGGPAPTDGYRISIGSTTQNIKYSPVFKIIK